MEKKEEAAPPLEPVTAELPTGTQTVNETSTVTVAKWDTTVHAEPPKAAAEKEPCEELVGKANEEIAKLRDQISALESQVRLLRERRKGSRGS